MCWNWNQPRSKRSIHIHLVTLNRTKYHHRSQRNSYPNDNNDLVRSQYQLSELREYQNSNYNCKCPSRFNDYPKFSNHMFRKQHNLNRKRRNQLYLVTNHGTELRYISNRDCKSNGHNYLYPNRQERKQLHQHTSSHYNSQPC